MIKFWFLQIIFYTLICFKLEINELFKPEDIDSDIIQIYDQIPLLSSDNVNDVCLFCTITDINTTTASAGIIADSVMIQQHSIGYHIKKVFNSISAMINGNMIETHDPIEVLSLDIANDVCNFCTITAVDFNTTADLSGSSEEHDTLLQVLRRNMSDMLNVREIADTIMTAINGISFKSDASEILSVIFDEHNEVKVAVDIDVDVVVNEDDFQHTSDNAIASVGSIANQTTTTTLTSIITNSAESLQTRSIFDTLTSNATSAGVASLDNATVNADNLSSDAPEVLVVMTSPTYGSRITPSALPSLLAKVDVDVDIDIDIINDDDFQDVCDDVIASVGTIANQTTTSTTTTTSSAESL